MQTIRRDPNVLLEKRRKDRKEKERKRKNLGVRLNESKKARMRMQEKRKDLKLSKTKQEKSKTKMVAKQRVRPNQISEFYRYRENYINKVKRTENLQRKLLFILERASTPKFVCCCCEGLFFRHSVLVVDQENLRNAMNIKNKAKPMTQECFKSKILNYDSKMICRTCRNNVLNGNIPKLATSNGLKFPIVPDFVQELSRLEETMVIPYIPFIQIRELKPYSLNPQLASKGSVVNIPVEIEDMIKVLPRSFDDLSTVQIKLKRHIDHKTSYLHEVIRPGKVIKALEYLQTTELYKKYNILVDPAYIQRYQKHSGDDINFIVDDADKDDEPKEIDSESIRVIGSQDDNNNTKEERMDSKKGIKDNTNEANTENENMENAENADEENDAQNSFLDNDLQYEETLLVDRNAQAAYADDEILIIAPGQDKKPAPWIVIPHLDELVFPTVYGGTPLELQPGLSYAERVKSELRRRDRRCCKPHVLLFKAKQRLDRDVAGAMNIALRKVKSTSNLTAKNVLDKERINDLVSHDDGFRILKQIRSSPAFWQTKKKELMAMFRQLGKPTFFFTLSAGEKWWPELLQHLAKLQRNCDLSLEEAIHLDNNDKSELIRNDPVTCAMYFSYKVDKFINYLKSSNGPFDQHVVVDYFYRDEFQLRGSPHIHGFLYNNDAPKFDADKKETFEPTITFIDKHISCRYDAKNPYINFQMHRHTQTCHKGRKNKDKCRFDFPKFIMKRTEILTPLPEEEKTPKIKNNLKSIRKLMKELYKSGSEELELDTILEKLGISYQDYLLAIRSSIQRVQIFLQRNSLEVGINNYNIDLLMLWEANIDLQFVLDEYSAASYTINYIAKDESGTTKLLEQAVKDVQSGNICLKDKFRKIANTFLNSNLMGAQEAVFHCLSLPLCKKSRACIYINTSPRGERVMMLKSTKQLQELDPESTEITAESIIEKYSKRDKKLENTCLADYAAIYYRSTTRTSEEISELEDSQESQPATSKQSVRRKIIRYRGYLKEKDPVNYYREQVMLFLPWRNEEEFENENSEELYEKFKPIILDNAKHYTIISEERILY